ncbi:MAG: hypothetical protein KKG59_01985 [Nanoarchaeota archaeon]|nr:hypothetical protein [Nanoarchaeota archaeon]
MSLKEFLKPTLGKVVLFLILMIGLNYFHFIISNVLDARILVGLPLGFWPVGSFYMFPGAPTPPVVEFSWINFIADIIFWYIVSCIPAALYHKIKK